MASVIRTKDPDRPAEDWHPPASEMKEAVRRILESQPFRTSQQCQDLLRYIVDQSLRGDSASLRERVIGAEVFGRTPTYDTNEDPVVRVRAADVRKRLALYYQSLEPGTPVWHIELQPGSYRAAFRHEPAALIPPVSLLADETTWSPAESGQLRSSMRVKKRSRLFRWWTVVAFGTMVAAVAAMYLWSQPLWKTPQERFWAPLTGTKQPVLLYLGSNAAYVFSADYLAKYRAAHGITNTGPELFVDLPPNGSVRTGDLNPVRDTFVTTGDLAATVQVTSLLDDWKKAFVLRSGRDLSFGDIRNRPSVMIGGFNNPWTLELTSELRYSFQQGTRIQDREHPEQGWSVTLPQNSDKTDDYALISRLLQSKTGGTVLTVAGVGEYGTQAAAEFLASPNKMRSLLQNAPRGWENKNMQVVLHIKVVGYAPVAIEVAATTYW